MHLGDRSFQKKLFPLHSIVQKTKDLKTLSEQKRFSEINRVLLELIQEEKPPCFLLPAVLDFIERIDQEKLLSHYTFSSFELWLNQSSGLSAEENLHIRGKIVGKWIDRSDYQSFFPIGMGKIFEGTHFVTAHKSPDLDTTIASFWGWVDAFGARVGDSLHVWNLPGGPPSSQIEIQWIFEDVFGKGVFTHLPKTRTSLNLTARDLMSKSGMVLKTSDDFISGADHEGDHQSIVVVDSQGCYLGDWRSIDVEEVRQIIILLSSCLRWFENHLHLDLIAAFANKSLYFETIWAKVCHLFSMSLKDCGPVKDFSSHQKVQVSQFLSSVLGVKEGLSVTFNQICERLSPLIATPFKGVDWFSHAMRGLFDSKGCLIESRPEIFLFLEGVVRELHESILQIRERFEKLDIALKTKTEVFRSHPVCVTTRSDVDEIREKMGSFLSLTVADSDSGGTFPMGVISSKILRKSILGTVSLRDFCNRDEMTIPPYLDVISVIDHHKTQLHTFAPPFAVIADAQSCNSLVARQAFIINDEYSLGGQTMEGIDRQIQSLSKDSSLKANRLLVSLLKKKNIASKNLKFFVDVEREYLEYLHFLYAILDDTDLLSKVSVIDVECVAALLNRLKSLSLGEETEVISLHDIPKDKHFPKKAAERILRNEEMYSLYNKVYAHREKEVADHIVLAASGKPSHFFADTKVQNGCCRVGQTKLFARNIPVFLKFAKEIQSVWLADSLHISQEKPEIDLYMHMVSTIVSADEVYTGSLGNYSHQDEMWLWIPSQDAAVEHLKRFLTSFQGSPGLKNNPLEVECMGPRAAEFEAYFKESFFAVPIKVVEGPLSIAMIRYKAGSLNSRKAMISPFLPT